MIVCVRVCVCVCERDCVISCHICYLQYQVLLVVSLIATMRGRVQYWCSNIKVAGKNKQDQYLRIIHHKEKSHIYIKVG